MLPDAPQRRQRPVLGHRYLARSDRTNMVFCIKFVSTATRMSHAPVVVRSTVPVVASSHTEASSRPQKRSLLKHRSLLHHAAVVATVEDTVDHHVEFLSKPSVPTAGSAVMIVSV